MAKRLKLPIDSITADVKHYKKNNTTFWHDIVDKNYDGLVQKTVEEKSHRMYQWK